MRWWIAAFALLVLARSARADVFDVKNLDGFEACLDLDHLIETINTPDGEQTRILGPLEIQPRCVEAAAHLLAGAKRADVVMPFILAGKRGTAWENTLPLIEVVTRISPQTCDHAEVYDVIARSLERPDGKLVVHAKAIASACVKDAAFRKDLVDELGSHEGHLAEHACDILIDTRLVKACKGSKP